MKLETAFLGTGNSNSSERNPSATAISNGTEILMVDFGGGAYHQLSRLGRSTFSHDMIEYIFLTHYHIDHVSGLPDFLWGEMWDTVLPRKKPVQIIGPPGLRNFWEKRLLDFIGREIPFEVKLTEINDGSIFDCPWFSAESVKLNHNEESTAYIFNLYGKKMSFTGDTGFCSKLIEVINRSDVSVCEWSFPGESPVPSHMGLPEIKKLLDNINSDCDIYFTHIYKDCGKTFPEQVKDQARSAGTVKNNIYFPHDMHILSQEI